MAKPVKGFMSDDAHFFESKEEADLHEARVDLEVALQSKNIANVDLFITAVDVLHEEISNYIEAKRAVRKGLSDLGYSDDDRAGEDDAETLQSQSSNSGQPVSNVGSGQQSAPVQQQRTEHGVGVRQRDARRIRRGPGMAVGARPKPTTARRRNRQKGLGTGTLEENPQDD